MNTKPAKPIWHQVRLADGRLFNFIARATANRFLSRNTGAEYVGTRTISQLNLPDCLKRI